MKKILATLILSTSFLHALYMGNPSAPEDVEEGVFFCSDYFAVKAGYRGDLIIDRKFKSKEAFPGNVDHFRALFNQGVLTLNFFDRLEAYGSAGIFNTVFAIRPEIAPIHIDYETSEKYAWGAGLKFTLFDWENFSVGLDGKYQKGKAHVEWIAFNGEGVSPTKHLSYQEWQVAGGVSYHVCPLIPYCGLTYSRAKAHTRYAEEKIRMRSRHFFGTALGCTFTTGVAFDLTLETQLINEDAITLTGNFKF